MQSMAIRIAIMTAALLLAAVGFVAVAVFLCMALYSSLSIVLTPPWAALGAAGILLLVSVVIIMIGSAVSRAAARNAARASKKKSNATATAKLGGELGRLLGENAFNFITEKPARVLIGALVAGFAVGASPRLRSFLQSILKP
jgi:membrane protein implicated in regulation of membrane protease activity